MLLYFCVCVNEYGINGTDKMSHSMKPTDNCIAVHLQILQISAKSHAFIS